MTSTTESGALDKQVHDKHTANHKASHIHSFMCYEYMREYILLKHQTDTEANLFSFPSLKLITHSASLQCTVHKENATLPTLLSWFTDFRLFLCNAELIGCTKITCSLIASGKASQSGGKGAVMQSGADVNAGGYFFFCFFQAEGSDLISKR